MEEGFLWRSSPNEVPSSSTCWEWLVRDPISHHVPRHVATTSHQRNPQEALLLRARHELIKFQHHNPETISTLGNLDLLIKAFSYIHRVFHLVYTCDGKASLKRLSSSQNGPLNACDHQSNDHQQFCYPAKEAHVIGTIGYFWKLVFPKTSLAFSLKKHRGNWSNWKCGFFLANTEK